MNDSFGRSKNALRTGRAAIACGLVLAGCTNVRIDERTVFRPQARADPARTPAELERWPAATLRAEYADVRVAHAFLGDGVARVAYTHLAMPGRERPLVVVCGGNASDRWNSGIAYARRALAHADVLLFDYPGYGDSPGVASAAVLESASRQVAALAVSLSGERPLIFWGHSLGGFVCSGMARETPTTDGVVLETTARTAREVAVAWTPWYARSLVSVEVADTLASYDVAVALRGFRGPVLVLGAGRDRVLPVELSRSLYAALRAQGTRAEYVELPEASHADAPREPGFAPAVARYFDRF